MQGDTLYFACWTKTDGCRPRTRARAHTHIRDHGAIRYHKNLLSQYNTMKRGGGGVSTVKRHCTSCTSALTTEPKAQIVKPVPEAKPGAISRVSRAPRRCLRQHVSIRQRQATEPASSTSSPLHLHSYPPLSPLHLHSYPPLSSGLYTTPHRKASV